MPVKSNDSVWKRVEGADRSHTDKVRQNNRKHEKRSIADQVDRNSGGGGGIENWNNPNFGLADRIKR